MRDCSLSNTVHAILRHGLALRERLETGAPLRLEVEQAALAQLLAPLKTEEVWTAAEDDKFEFDFSEADPEERRRLSRATVGHALTCWLDEFLLQYSLWAERWGKQALETVLYGNGVRSETFWEEAHYAEVRGDLEALEALYWCVVLGFRGSWRDKPERIEAWLTRIGTLLQKRSAAAEPANLDWAPLAEETLPDSDLPYRRMLFTALWTLTLVLPAALWLSWRH